MILLLSVPIVTVHVESTHSSSSSMNRVQQVQVVERNDGTHLNASTIHLGYGQAPTVEEEIILAHTPVWSR